MYARGVFVCGLVVREPGSHWVPLHRPVLLATLAAARSGQLNGRPRRTR